MIEAAATHPAHLATVVSLSGERQIGSYRDIIADARHVNVPSLYVAARDDPLIGGPQQHRQLHLAFRGHPHQLLLVDGSAHGTELLDVGLPGGRTIADRLLDFTQHELASR